MCNTKGKDCCRETRNALGAAGALRFCSYCQPWLMRRRNEGHSNRREAAPVRAVLHRSLPQHWEQPKEPAAGQGWSGVPHLRAWAQTCRHGAESVGKEQSWVLAAVGLLILMVCCFVFTTESVPGWRVGCCCHFELQGRVFIKTCPWNLHEMV